MHKTLALLGLIILFWLVNFYSRHYVYPNTYLVNTNLGQQNQKTVLNRLAQQQEQKLKIKVEKRIYTFTYADLGIIFDLNQTYTVLTQESKLPIFKRFIALAKSFISQKMVLPELIFTEKYYQRLAKLKFDFSQRADEVLVNEKKPELTYYNHQDLFRIDPNSLKKEIVLGFNQNQVLRPKIHRFFDETTHYKIDQYNQKIKQVVNKPVSVYLENGRQAVFSFIPTELQKIVQINYEQTSETLSIGIKEAIFNQTITNLQNHLLNSDLQFNKEKLKQDLISLISTRFNGYASDHLYAELIEKPNTQGKHAKKYIEIDLSQQKMYLWEDGETLAIHIISSGLYFPTPPGEYKILNKAVNAYSYLYHVWMPYWMAFSLDPTVNAYLGIHELPYYYDVTGTEIRRPRDFLGSPHTGGCVSLDVGIAEQVYQWAEVGTPVVIYE